MNSNEPDPLVMYHNSGPEVNLNAPAWARNGRTSSTEAAMHC